MSVQLLIFIYWSNIVLPYEKDPDFKEQDKYCSWSIVALSGYLLGCEIAVLVHLRAEWFAHFNNVLGAIADVLLIYNCSTKDVDS